MIIFVKEVIGENGRIKKEICFGSTHVERLETFDHALFAASIGVQRVAEPDNTDLEVVDKIISILETYPEGKLCSVSSRAYPKQGVITIGFTDHLGKWDPLLTCINAEIRVMSMEEIVSEVEGEIF